MNGIATKRLIELEGIVSKGMANFVEVGNALMAIRDEFKGEFASLGYKDFDEYCRSKWNMSRVHAWRIIGAAETAAMLPQGNVTSEKQVRPLTKLKDPDDQREAWSIANEASNGKPTAKDVEEAVKKVIPKRPFPEPALTPAEVERVAQAEKDSEVLWTLKSYWKRATKKDRTEFRAWISQQ